MVTTDRLVYTHRAPDGQARGLVIGEPIGPGAVLVEHVIVFPRAPRSALREVMQGAARAAREHGYRSAIVYVPDTDRSGALSSLLARYHFAPYATTPDGAWWHRWMEDEAWPT